MNKCDLTRNLVMAYHYGLLEDKERKDIEKHLKSCPECARVYKTMLAAQKKMAKSVGAEKVPNDLRLILAKAKKIESERIPAGPLAALAEKFLGSFTAKLAAAGAFAAVIILVSAIWLASTDVNYLYMTRATGDVKVNDKQLFVAENYIYRLEIRKPVKIGVGQGECQFQINRNKYFEMRPLTRILVEKGKDIIVNFLEGMLIGKVVHERNALGLQVVTPNRNAVFNIIGTLFYVKSTNREIEFGVREGEVRVETGVSNRTFSVRSSEVIRVGDDNVRFLTNTNRNGADMDGIFSKLDQYVLRSNFNDARQIVIRTEPSGSDIYWKDKPLGKSPLFIMGDREQYKSLTVVRKGYVSREFEIRNGKSFDVEIKPELPPEVMWNLGMTGAHFISPVVAQDGSVLVGDQVGWFYKLDPVRKKILWKFKAGLRNNSVPLVVNHTVYFSSTDEYLHALRYDTGQPIWKQKVGMLVYSGPQLNEGKIYTANIEGMVYALDAANGKVLWEKKFDDGFYTSPLLKNGNIYLGATSGTIYSLRAGNGTLIWQYRTGDRIVSFRPFISDRKVFFGSNDKKFYALDAESGKLLWTADIGSEIFTSPVDWGDSVIVSSIRGEVFSLDKKDGKINWSFNTGKKILLNPHLVQGKYLFVSAEKTLYIFNKWGILFTQYPFKTEIADYTVSADKKVYLCGSEGDMRMVRFLID